MKQTAVEWFIEKTIESGHLWVTDTPSDMTELGKLIEQAKQMENEQHRETWFESTSQFANEAEMLYKKDFEQYYNGTFKQQEQ